MGNAVPRTDFYPPDRKELGLGICYVVAQNGGCLSFLRTCEILKDVLHIPRSSGNKRSPSSASHTEWSYAVSWTCTQMRRLGFMDHNSHSNRSMCVLTKHGKELGEWAARIFAGDDAQLPDWVAAFLQPLFKRMQSLLAGGKKRKPPDYELCRWVHYCYLCNKPTIGVALFDLVLADSVDARFFALVERQARIMRIGLEEEAGQRNVTGSRVTPRRKRAKQRQTRSAMVKQLSLFKDME